VARGSLQVSRIKNTGMMVVMMMMTAGRQPLLLETIQRPLLLLLALARVELPHALL